MVQDLQKKLATGATTSEAETINGITLSARNLGDVPPRDLKGIADAIGQQLGEAVVALVSTAEGKASIVVSVAASLTARISAVDLVRAAAAAVGGKGRPAAVRTWPKPAAPTQQKPTKPWPPSGPRWRGRAPIPG